MKILKFWNGIPCAIIIVNFTWVQFVVAINIFVDLFSFFYQVTGHSLGEFQDSRSQNILKLECGTLLYTASEIGVSSTSTPSQYKFRPRQTGPRNQQFTSVVCFYCFSFVQQTNRREYLECLPLDGICTHCV
jgi:hypothetical protein